jgi:predicted amino acid racemase
LKVVQEKAGNTLELTGTGNSFLNRTPKAQQIRERIDKWDYMKLKSKGNGHQIKEAAHRMGENLCQLYM